MNSSHAPTNQPRQYRVEDDAELAALSAYDADAWLAGATPGMSRAVADARAAMVDAHSDPHATADDVAQAERDYHAACLAQSADLARSREAAAARVEALMRAVRGAVEVERDATADRVHAVIQSTRIHAGVIHACIHPSRTVMERAAAG